MKFCLLGASFDTSNCGVSALAAGAVKGVVSAMPEADIVFLNYGRKNGQHELKIDGKIVPIELLNMGISKKIWQKNHILRLMVLAMAIRCLPAGLRRRVIKGNEYFRAICESDAVVAISGGDSFSDIYGLKRLIYVSLPQCLVVLLKAKLVLLPQTYGPFNSAAAKRIARFIFRRSAIIYSRDYESMAEVRRVMKGEGVEDKLRFSPDVGFILESSEAPREDIKGLLAAREKGLTIVGFNVSGLLFNGGYSRDNMFGLKTEYRILIRKVIAKLMEYNDVAMVLVPHVLTRKGDIESDITACSELYSEFVSRYPQRVFAVRISREAGEIKGIIGMTDFFVGSRMHSCIAALSQNIPAVGLAYSDKFHGVFDSIGEERLVIDLRNENEASVLSSVQKAFKNRVNIRAELENRIPSIKAQVNDMFRLICGDIKGVSQENCKCC